MVKNCDDMLSRFHLIPQCNGQTDRQTDEQICYINSMLTRDKKQQQMLTQDFGAVCTLVVFSHSQF